ncbi:succinate dehydrogenase cytochrome b subunit [Mesonia maritima]|uniref:Succinate dehydrogenase / fumarate reductase cytochrome b subunit n=1 Tax=Mesonia maritima TaxID=1793873 RepID=A0ABU1K376_9FLAO|nr:succinate dehydrogenase cytochrome b subunit [Mesonia maritima]MDR6300068.1 succinate dehydrogenase / fumarate reductase cytochrome b subunit [Mesonia maritima]
MGGLIQSSTAKKFAMALSGLFLVLFLAQHFTINLTSVISPEIFNELSHFMGTNFFVQALLQPVLIFGVVFHFIMGFVLEIKNRNARDIGYIKFKGSANSSWMSRNMIWSGLVVLAFLALHFYDFWVPELIHKYVESSPVEPDVSRYYDDLVMKFQSPIRTGLYVIAFIFLMLHLLHGFSSSFQSIGWNNKYSKGLRRFTVAYSIIIPLGFIFIALFHYINNL